MLPNLCICRYLYLYLNPLPIPRHLVGKSYKQEKRESHQSPVAFLAWMPEDWVCWPQFGAHLHRCGDLALHLRHVRLLLLIANLQVIDGLHLK